MARSLVSTADSEHPPARGGDCRSSRALGPLRAMDVPAPPPGVRLGSMPAQRVTGVTLRHVGWGAARSNSQSHDTSTLERAPGRDRERTDAETHVAIRGVSMRRSAIMSRRDDIDDSRHARHEGVTWPSGDTRQSVQHRTRYPASIGLGMCRDGCARRYGVGGVTTGSQRPAERADLVSALSLFEWLPSNSSSMVEHRACVHRAGGSKGAAQRRGPAWAPSGLGDGRRVTAGGTTQPVSTGRGCSWSRACGRILPGAGRASVEPRCRCLPAHAAHCLTRLRPGAGRAACVRRDSAGA